MGKRGMQKLEKRGAIECEMMVKSDGAKIRCGNETGGEMMCIRRGRPAKVKATAAVKNVYKDGCGRDFGLNVAAELTRKELADALGEGGAEWSTEGEGAFEYASVKVARKLTKEEKNSKEAIEATRQGATKMAINYDAFGDPVELENVEKGAVSCGAMLCYLKGAELGEGDAVSIPMWHSAAPFA